jgi:integrase
VLTQPKTKKRNPISSDAGVKAAPRGEWPVTGAVGLFLRVRATKKGSLTRRWIVRVSIRRLKFSLGAYPAVELARARQMAQDAHREVAEGKEPGVRAKRRLRLAEAARSLTLLQAIERSPAPSYKNPKSDEVRDRALRVHFAPLHARDVASITAADVASILRTLADQTAIKAHAAIRRVFDYATATLEPYGVPINNPAEPRRLRAVGWSAKPSGESTQHPAVHWRVMPEVVAELERMDDVSAACAQYIAATGVRAQTARLTKWDNIDFKARTWTPPFVDLKEKHHKRAFIVPLNDVALGALERVRNSPLYAFANSAGRPLTDGDLTNLLRRLRRRHPDWLDPDTKRPFTLHGFRAALRTWTEEKHETRAALAELSFRGEVETRYIRTGVVEERRALLDLWSRHLRGETAQVISISHG